MAWCCMKKESDNPAAWFAKADKDLTLAQRALQPEPLPELACYHAQQCAEKYLKGYLKSKKIAFKWMHDLAYLLSVCATCDAGFNDLNEDAVDLTRLAELYLWLSYKIPLLASDTLGLSAMPAMIFAMASSPIFG